uniref:Interleukin-8-like n=1 Tax=Sinocyclocheilus grahami TaxID=75366 RepID=A0A672LVI4_SINGR
CTMRKFTTSAFVFLTCMTLLSTTEVIAARLPAQQLRCQCVKTYSGKPINPKLIQKVQMIPAGAQCKNMEIIATLKNGQTCLNPRDEWVKNIIKLKAILLTNTLHE